MSANKSCCRHQKVGIGGVTSVGKHNEREREDHLYGESKVDPSRSYLNYELHRPEIPKENYLTEWEMIVERENLGGKLKLKGVEQKQSKIMGEFVLGASGDFIKDLPETEQKRLFETMYEWACTNFGQQFIISAKVHMDETTPHMHLCYVPVKLDSDGKPCEFDKKGRAKISMSSVWDSEITRAGEKLKDGTIARKNTYEETSYSRLQSNFLDYMRNAGYDLMYEKKITKAQKRDHLEQLDFAVHSASEKIAEITPKLEKLESVYKSTSNRQNNLAVEVSELETRKTLLSDFGVDMGAIKKAADVKPEITAVTVAKTGFNILADGLKLPQKFRAEAEPEVKMKESDFVALKKSAIQAQVNQHIYIGLTARSDALEKEKERLEREKKLMEEKQKEFEEQSKQISEREKNVSERERNAVGLEQRERVAKELHFEAERVLENPLRAAREELQPIQDKLQQSEADLRVRHKEVGRLEDYQKFAEALRDHMEQWAVLRIRAMGGSYGLTQEAVKEFCDGANKLNSDLRKAGTSGGWMPPMVRTEKVIERVKQLEKSGPSL